MPIKHKHLSGVVIIKQGETLIAGSTISYGNDCL